MTNQIAKVRKLAALLVSSLDGYERHPHITDKLDCDAKLLCEALVEMRIELGLDRDDPTKRQANTRGEQ